MEQVKVFYDRTGNTLTVWFGDSQDEYICEETGDEVILMKDRAGRVIGKHLCDENSIGTAQHCTDHQRGRKDAAAKSAADTDRGGDGFGDHQRE